MKLHLEWARPMPLTEASVLDLIYAVDLKKLPNSPGIYILGRRWGSDFEALYVGKANNIRSRVKRQLNNLRLMHHLKNAKSGKRVLLIGRFITKRGQKWRTCIGLSERALIRYFISEGHDLVNKQGTRLKRHEVLSSGNHPKRHIPRLMYLEKARGE